MVNEDKIPEEGDIVFRIEKEFIGRCEIFENNQNK